MSSPTKSSGAGKAKLRRRSKKRRRGAPRTAFNAVTFCRLSFSSRHICFNLPCVTSDDPLSHLYLFDFVCSHRLSLLSSSMTISIFAENKTRARKGKLDPSCAHLLSSMMILDLLLAANDFSCNKKLNVCKQMTQANDSFENCVFAYCAYRAEEWCLHSRAQSHTHTQATLGGCAHTLAEEGYSISIDLEFQRQGTEIFRFGSAHFLLRSSRRSADDKYNFSLEPRTS